MNKPDKYLSASEVSCMLGVCRDTVYRMIRDNSIKGVRVRGQWRIKTSDVYVFIEQNTNLPQTCDNY
jgi:excisionase family DNA binding protein